MTLEQRKHYMFPLSLLEKVPLPLPSSSFLDAPHWFKSSGHTKMVTRWFTWTSDWVNQNSKYLETLKGPLHLSFNSSFFHFDVRFVGNKNRIHRRLPASDWNDNFLVIFLLLLCIFDSLSPFTLFAIKLAVSEDRIRERRPWNTFTSIVLYSNTLKLTGCNLLLVSLDMFMGKCCEKSREIWLLLVGHSPFEQSPEQVFNTR